MRPMKTKEAIEVLGIDRKTLFKWGDQGKVRVKRDKIFKYRIFDYDQIMKIAEKMPKKWSRGYSKLEKKK